jgi:hypothetical protein
MWVFSTACAPTLRSWDAGLSGEGLRAEDRLWHVVFPLSVAAADHCVFQQEATYGFFLEESVISSEEEGPSPPAAVQVRYVYPQLPAGKAGMAVGDRIVAINGDPLPSVQAEKTMEYMRKLTQARIQPLTLTVQRGPTVRDIHLWAVPSCRVQVKLVDNPVVNAVTNGPHIIVTTGLLAILHSPDELAWVLAHEFGHVAYDHSGRTTLQLTLDRFLAANAGVPPQGVARIEFERQADRFAAALVMRAGFDLRKARDLLERMQRVEPDQATVGFALSHPSSRERIEAIDGMIPELERQRALGDVPLPQ